MPSASIGMTIIGRKIDDDERDALCCEAVSYLRVPRHKPAAIAGTTEEGTSWPAKTRRLGQGRKANDGGKGGGGLWRQVNVGVDGHRRDHVTFVLRTQRYARRADAAARAVAEQPRNELEVGGDEVAAL